MPARSSTYAADWRSQPSRPTGTPLRLARWAATGLVLLLLGCLIFFVSWLFPGRTTVAISCLPIQQYDPLVASPIGYAWLDAGQLERLYATAEDGDDDLSEVPGQAFATQIQADFFTRLADRRADVLICAVWARPQWDLSRLVLVCSDWEPHHRLAAGGSAGEGPVLLLSELLQAMAENPAEHKILILDAGRGGVGPNGGIPTLDLESLVQAELARITPASRRIWIWLTNSSWEQSYVMPDRQRSVFHHFLAQALQGQADGMTAQGADRVQDRRIDLAEAAEYVRRNVSAWVWSQSRGGRTQTPRLLSSVDGDPLADARQVVLRFLPPTDASETADDDAVAAAEPQDAGSSDGPATTDVPPGENGPGPSGSEASEPVPPASAAQPVTALSPAEPNATEALAVSRASLNEELAWLDAVSPTLKEILLPWAQAREHPLTACAKLESELSGWTPVDFAPHLVRRFEELMVAYYLRAMSLPRRDSEHASREADDHAREREIGIIRNEVAVLVADYHRNVCGSARSFRGSQTQVAWDRSQPMKELIRSRNRTLLELPYYIRILTKLPAAVDERVFYDETRQLIVALERLTLALESDILKRAHSGTGPAKWIVSIDSGGIETDLETLIGEVDKQRLSLRRRLGLSSAEDLASRDRFYLLDLLATPLLDPAERTRLTQRVLDSPDTEALAELAAPSAVQRDNARQRAQRQAWLQVRLEAKASLLSDSGHDQRAWLRQRLDEWPTEIRDQAETLTQRLLDLQAHIWQHGHGPGEPTEDGAPPTFRTEMALRMLPAWFTEQAKYTRILDAPVGVPVRWSEVEVPLRFLAPDGSDPGPLPLSPRLETLVWTLKVPAGTVREGLRLHVEYPEDLLQVTGQEGRRVRGREFWQIEHAVELTEVALPFQVRPLKQDGSQARVTIQLLDEGLERLRASASVQLPEPSLLNVSIAGPEGTLEGDLRGAMRPAAGQGQPMREVRFNESGHARVALRPYPSGSTPYEITASNPSSRDWQVRATVWVIPDPLRLQHGHAFDPWDPASQGPVSGCVLQARSEWTIPANGTLPVPLFPQPAADNPDDQSDGEAPAPAPMPAPEPVEVAGGLLCLLEHSGQQQRLWLDVRPLHPEAYLEPEVRYDPAQQRIEIQVRAPLAERLPPGLTRIRWQLPRDLQNRIQQQRQPPEFDLRAEVARMSARLDLDPSVWRSVPVVISADGYPRAFEYECPLSGAVSHRKVTERWHAEVLLYEVDESGQFKRDELGQPIPIPENKGFSKLEQIGVLFRADTPPSGGDWDFGLRVFLQGQEASEGDTALGESQEFFRDRDVSVQLQLPESGRGFVLQSSIRELTAVLRSGYRNQEIIVRGEVRSVPRQGGPSTLERHDQRSVWHDDLPPRIVGVSPTEVTAGDLIVVDAEDRHTGVVEVLYARELDPTGKMLEPAKAKRLQSTTDSKPIFQVSSESLKPGQDHTLFLAATDGAGNTSIPSPHRIHVKAVPVEPTREPEMMPPETKKIEGVVLFDNRGMRATTVVLKGPKQGRTVTDNAGRFEFSDLPPGEYELEASRHVQSQFLRATRQADLTGPAPEVTVKLVLR